MGDVTRCALSDEELHEAVQSWVSKLCDTGGRAWALSVPVNFDRDPDMLVTELCKRYAALLTRHNALREAVKKERSYPLKLTAMSGTLEQQVEYGEARADVDRLLGGE